MNHPMTAWEVYCNGMHIDTVYYVNNHTAEDVRYSLINHDGYSSDITVRKVVKQTTQVC